MGCFGLNFMPPSAQHIESVIFEKMDFFEKIDEHECRPTGGGLNTGGAYNNNYES